MKVSIQGYEGSFHQIAARQFLGADVEVIPCATFRDLVKIAADTAQSNGGIMAIENSIAGSILPNYTLLQKAGLQICGEIYLQINQDFMVNPGVIYEQITEVQSHPMALLQCIDFLEEHPEWKLVESEDTALSAKKLQQSGSRTTAVIASGLAAELFGLEIIAPKIQSNKNNYTRFLFLQPRQNTKTIAAADKASVHFITDHSKGSLAKVLTKIAEYGINLSKLQSVPIPEQEWHYSFHADLEFKAEEQFELALKNIAFITEALTVLGIYKKGLTVAG